VERDIYLDNAVRSDHPARSADFQICSLVGHNKGRDITVRAYYKVSEKKDDEQGDIIRVVRGAALICF
jgi:hypothetical protein